MADKKLEVNVQHIIKDIEAGKFTSFQSILNEAGGQHIYEAVNEELRKYLKENNAVMISATQLAHLRETGYKDFESERKALETQLKTATGDLKKQIESKLKDLKKFQYYSERKAPIGDELHKILELSDKGLVDLNDAVKAANQIMQQMQIDPHTSEKLKSLVGRTSTDTMKNFRKAIKNAQDFQKMKVSAGMIGGETETARSMAFKKDGKLYVVSGSTDWTKAKEGKIGDYKTTASFSAMHNLIQSVVNATLIRAQEGENLPITSKVAHLPISAGRTKYSNTLPGVYDINVGSYQEGVKLISDLVDVLEGKRDYTSIRIPGSVQGKVEKGQFTYKNEIKEATYYNGKPIGQWIGQTVEEVKGLLDSLAPQQRQQFLGTLFGQTDGKPWYNTENAKVLKEAFRGLYQPIEKQYKTYGGMTLGALSGKFSAGDIGKQDVINAIKEGVQTQTDAEELASRLFYGGEKYYSEAFVKVIQDAIPEISDKMTEIFDRELDKDMPGYLSGLSEEEKPKPSKYEMYQPDVWELEEKRQQTWIESGIERKRLGYTDKPLFDDKGVTTLADRMTRLVDFYQRVNNIFTNIANDINKNLPEGTQAYTGEELARTYLARKSPEVYDRYMRSKGLYEQFASEAQNLSIEDQVKWIREQLDTFIAEEGNLLNTFDTFNEIADERSKKIFSTEFARKIGYVGKPSDYVAPGTLYGLLTGSTFGVAQEYQLSEFDKQRGLDIYGRTLSPEALDKLEETQVDDDISKIDFYKKRLSEMTEELGISSEKMKIFADYLDKVQKVADQAGIELDQVLEGIDEKGFIKKGSLLDKQLSELGEMPVETDLYLPRGKRGLSVSERSTLMGLLDETGMDNLTTQYEVYLNEQDNKRKEELQKQEEIRVEKEKEFTKLMDFELENRLKFLYAETQKPEYLKRQEAAERGEDLGLTEEMFTNFPEKPQKGLDIGETKPEVVKVAEENVAQTTSVNESNQELAEVIKEEVEAKKQEINSIKSNNEIQDVRKRGKINNEYDNWVVDKIIKNELGEVTDTIYKRGRKSSGTRGPSGISQVVDKVIPAVESIDQNIKEINEKMPSSFKNIDWDSFQNLYNKTGILSDEGGTPAGGSGGRGGGKRGKGDEEKAEADLLKSQKQDIKDYQQYVNKLVSLESQVDKFQRQAALSSGKQKDAIENTVDALNQEIAALNSSNSGLVERVSREQAATKAQIDSTAALRKQTNEQKNLVSVKGATSIWDMMANDIRRATMRIADFGVAAKVLNKIPQDIQKVIQYTKELDAAMTNVRIVTGASAEEAKTLARGYTELAKELGSTTVEIANSANEWNRQGYTAEEANDLIIASTKLAKLGMISTTEATKDLTSAIKGFKLSTEDAMSVVDKLTKIDQVAAISAGNLAEGLARVSTTAQQAGLSLDETAAMVTTITEVTQRDASTAGEALRTLISRYSNVKAGVFTDMSDGAEETSSNINDIEKVLSKLGIRVRTSGTEMRSIEDVLDELAEKWDTLDDVSRNAVASAFAGVRQRESFNILLSNWDRVKELTEESANAAGTADEKYTAYMDSMEAATKRLQNAWEGLTQSLETSSVMKLLTNATAILVENMDKLKYIFTYITAASSAKIFDFFTNKGETGGLKGLLSNIPILGDRLKTNNILESIDRKVGVIQGEVKKDNITKNGGLISRIKAGFAQRKADKIAVADKVTDLSEDEIDFIKASYDYDEDAYTEAMKARIKNKQDAAERLAADKAMRTKAFGKTAAIAGISTLLTQLGATKTVGTQSGGLSGELSKLIVGSNNTQSVEETAGDKAARTAGATIGAVAGAATAFIPVVGPLIAPIASSLGSVAGEGIGGLLSTWFHKDELEMKQRVADAKENLQRLDGIKSSLDENSSIMTEDLSSTEDYEKLYKFTDDLYDKLYDLQYEGDVDIVGAFNKIATNSIFGDAGIEVENISDLCEQINNGNKDQRAMIKRQLALAEAQVNLEELKKSQEEEMAKISAVSEYTADIKKLDYIGNPNDIVSEISEFLRSDISKELSDLKLALNVTGNPASGRSSFDVVTGIKGATSEEQLQNLSTVIDKVEQQGKQYKNIVEILKKYQNQISANIVSIKDLSEQIIASEVNIGLLSADIYDLNTSELNDLTMEGVMGRVVSAMEKQGYSVRNTAGYIKNEYRTAIEQAIKSNTQFAALQQADTKTLGQLTVAQENFNRAIKESKDYIKYGDSWEKWYDAALRGVLSEEMQKLVYAANPDRIKQFASAWNMTVEQVKRFAKEFSNVTTAIGLMSPDEVRDYYSVYSELFDDIADGSALTTENLEKIISSYPQLLKSYKQGIDEFRNTLLESMKKEQVVAYANSLFSEIISSSGIGSEFLRALKESPEDFGTLWSGENFLTESGEGVSYDAIMKEVGGIKTLNEALEVADKLKQSNNADDVKQGELIESLIEQYTDFAAIVEWTDPLYEKARQAEINILSEQIENLNEQKDALSNVNDERQREIDLIKAKDALENAKKQKKRVYREGVGWSYEADETAISSARENLESLDIEKRQEDLQYQIEQIELQKEILENLDENKQKEANKKALEEWSGGKNIDNVVTALTEGFSAAQLKYNPSTGEIVNGAGELVYQKDMPSIDSKIAAEQEARESAIKELETLKSTYTSGGFSTEATKGTPSYTAAVDEFNRNREQVEEKVEVAKSAGVSEEDEEYKAAVEWLKNNPQQSDADYIIIPKLTNPTSSVVGGAIHKLEGTDLVLRADNEVDSGTMTKQFTGSGIKDKLAIKRYDASQGVWGDWVNGANASVLDLPDYSIVMNSNFKDYYAFVKNGKLYWICDKNSNIKKSPLDDGSKWATGTLSTPDTSTSLINELGTEAIITPSGTVTALPAKTGIVPADITKNLWSLGEIAPTLVAQLGSLNQKAVSGVAGNTTYEEGQYFDNFTMNVYPASGDDFSKILEQARARVKLTRHNN